jgi:hypothetical protein
VGSTLNRDPGDENVARIGGLPLDEAEAFALGLSDRDRLAGAAFVGDTLRRNWLQRGTYRALLDELRFGPANEVDPYRVLMAAGALDIQNALPDDPSHVTLGDAD